jgi:hypothetical protein
MELSLTKWHEYIELFHTFNEETSLLDLTLSIDVQTSQEGRGISVMPMAFLGNEISTTVDAYMSSFPCKPCFYAFHLYRQSRKMSETRTIVVVLVSACKRAL